MRTHIDRRPGPSKAAGFTILELLVVIFIMLAMTGIAVAAFRNFLDTERIRLAGGDVTSAISMARQYAMSKRCRVMVAFEEPETTFDEQKDVAPCDLTYVQGGNDLVPASDMRSTAFGQLAAGKCNEFVGNETTSDQQTLAKFDLTKLPAGITELRNARLEIRIGASGGVVNLPATLRIAEMSDDNWSATDVTWNSSQAVRDAANQITTVTVPKNADGTFSPVTLNVNVTSNIFSAYINPDDKKFSVQLKITTNSNCKLSDITVKLVLDYACKDPELVGKAADMPRKVRIIPYLRRLDPDTGRVTWLLDEDDNALRLTYLPAQVHYELLPCEAPEWQYSPTSPPDYKREVTKRFMKLEPDGSCVAEPTAEEGWDVGSTQANAVILRDQVTGSVGLISVPPTSSFTRSRYLFAEEVDAFVAAHSTCAPLWTCSPYWDE